MNLASVLKEEPMMARGPRRKVPGTNRGLKEAKGSEGSPRDEWGRYTARGPRGKPPGTGGRLSKRKKSACTGEILHAASPDERNKGGLPDDLCERSRDSSVDRREKSRKKTHTFGRQL